MQVTGRYESINQNYLPVEWCFTNLKVKISQPAARWCWSTNKFCFIKITSGDQPVKLLLIATLFFCRSNCFLQDDINNTCFEEWILQGVFFRQWTINIYQEVYIRWTSFFLNDRYIKECTGLLITSLFLSFGCVEIPAYTWFRKAASLYTNGICPNAV